MLEKSLSGNPKVKVFDQLGIKFSEIFDVLNFDKIEDKISDRIKFYFEDFGVSVFYH